MNEKHCAWCDQQFFTQRDTKIYCSAECRERAAREKITQRYIAVKRRKRLTKMRRCAGGCGTLLSIYNDSNLCAACLVNIKKYGSFLKELKGIINEEN